MGLNEGGSRIQERSETDRKWRAGGKRVKRVSAGAVVHLVEEVIEREWRSESRHKVVKFPSWKLDGLSLVAFNYFYTAYTVVWKPGHRHIHQRYKPIVTLSVVHMQWRMCICKSAGSR